MKKLILILPFVVASFACQDRVDSEERQRAAETYESPSNIGGSAGGTVGNDTVQPSTGGGTFQNDVLSPSPTPLPLGSEGSMGEGGDSPAP